MSKKTGTITPFGKYVRTMRIHHDEFAKDMAQKLDVNPQFLSAVETGRRNPPHGWAERLHDVYELTDDEYAELVQVIEESRTYENLNVAHLTVDDRRIMRMMCEGLPELSKERRMILLNWLTEL